jgi:hypothetical protein
MHHIPPALRPREPQKTTGTALAEFLGGIFMNLVLDERTIDELNADVIRLRMPKPDEAPALPRNLRDALDALTHAVYHGSEAEVSRRATRIAALALRLVEEGKRPELVRAQVLP